MTIHTTSHRDGASDAKGQTSETGNAPDQWYTSGCIIHQGKAHLVTIHRSLLIMNTRRFAGAQADAHERDAKTATTDEARALMNRIGRDLRRWAEGDREFLESRTTLWQCSVSVAIRAKIGYLKVNEANYQEYLAEVMERTVPARRIIAPSFLFLTGPGQPELFATQESAHLVEFAGEWMHRQVVSKKDLLRLYLQVAKDYPITREVQTGKPDTSDRAQFNSDLMRAIFCGVPDDGITFAPNPAPRPARTRRDVREKE